MITMKDLTMPNEFGHENLGLKEYKLHQEKANERRHYCYDEPWNRGSVVGRKRMK